LVLKARLWERAEQDRAIDAIDGKKQDAKFRYEAALNFPGARADCSMQRVVPDQLRNDSVAHFAKSRDVSTPLARRPGARPGRQN
jgi:hypothetical protein